MSAPASTRRALLGVIAAAPVAAAACVAGTPAHASSAAFDRQLAELRRLDAVHDFTCDEVAEVEGLYLACAPAHPVADCRVGDTAESYNARVKAQKAEHEAADRAARDAHQMDERYARQAAACDRAWDAMLALIAMPAPNLAAVALKIEIAIERGLEVGQLAPLLTDIRRLGGAA